mmetsp:Transcript_8920/g.17665  ORF Transcript_8920/g.17665 Transcript_8920/m.17665 type:complete len:96 (-) Transcript_8920:1356-1643(-)
MEEFILELNPMKTESVKEALKDIHTKKYAESSSCKNSIPNEGSKPVDIKSRKDGLLPEHSSELGVSQGKGPKTEVRSSVGNHTENKLNSLDGLMD